MTREQLEKLFGPVIYEYTDKQALEDGVLVDISSLGVKYKDILVNRMTQSVWDEFERFYGVTYDLDGNCLTDNFIPEMTKVLNEKMKLTTLDEGMGLCPPNYWLILTLANILP